MDFRDTPHVMKYVNGRDVSRYATTGPVTPDHVIRTKPKPLIVPVPIVKGIAFVCSRGEIFGSKLRRRVCALFRAE